jgi:DNA-directed RNA polymerase subunit F
MSTSFFKKDSPPKIKECLINKARTRTRIANSMPPNEKELKIIFLTSEKQKEVKKNLTKNNLIFFFPEEKFPLNY